MLEKLARHGQGLVLLAEDTRLGDRLCVIKISLLTAQEAALAAAEGNALGRIDHPHVGKVYNSGVCDDHPYLVLEFIRGETLTRWRETHQRQWQTMARLTAQVARGLSAAHALEPRVLHRDLKPSNILVCPGETAKLIDFGVALIKPKTLASPDAEGESGIYGTIGFMAPEQAAGDPSATTEASDIFGLGAVLYFLIAGQAPYTASGINALLEQARECRYEPGVLELAPRKLRQIALEALAREPGQRFASAAEMAAALENYATQRQRMRRRALAAAIAAGVVAIAALVWSRWPRANRFGPGTRITAALASQAELSPVAVRREGSELAPHNLRGLIPVPSGEGLSFVVRIPRGNGTDVYEPSLYWISRGKAIRRAMYLDPTTAGQPVARWTCPVHEKGYVETIPIVGDKDGMDLIVVIANPVTVGNPSAEQVAAAFSRVPRDLIVPGGLEFRAIGDGQFRLGPLNATRAMGDIVVHADEQGDPTGKAVSASVREIVADNSFVMGVGVPFQARPK